MKQIIKSFFETNKLDFDLDKDFEIKNYIIENKDIYFYSNENAKIPFYLVFEKLNEEEFIEFKRYIWNENKAKIYFLFTENELCINYANISPIDKKNIQIDRFYITKEEKVRYENIKKYNFDNGAFWLKYQTFLDGLKNVKSIDKELINALKNLKDKLEKEIKNTEIVQAFIDRTLYIKYLEDKHIINSFFYEYYFGNKELNYQKLLENKQIKNLNILFEKINEIFNNTLFNKPKIEKKYFTEQVCNLVSNTIRAKNINTGQLSLFDFKFNILPVEFISYIYEIFLEKKQSENGIFYTPKKLTQLIVDQVVIDKIGAILDPSCGSGMFLVTAFQKFLEIKPDPNTENISEIIKHRLYILSYIYGIEKELIAQRFSVFSLSLQIFNGLDSLKIRDFIKQELQNNNSVTVFKNLKLNIIQGNTLSFDNPFKEIKFDYIVGNPPFFNINDNKDFEVENKFINNYIFNNNKAKEIIGDKQISQCFFLKIKDFSNEKSRFGFVSNNSNFYNEYSNNFRKFFLENYTVEKWYELSKIKNILFEEAKEPVNSIIFNNQKLKSNSDFNYYKVEMGLFSKKPFQLLIIDENKSISISQNDVFNDEIKIRDFLIGNEYDLKLGNKLFLNNKLESYLINTNSNIGFQIWGYEAAKKEFGISKKKWDELDQNQKNQYKNTFYSKYIKNNKSDEFNIKLYNKNKLMNFKLEDPDLFVSDFSKFHRTRNSDIFTGKKILFNREGKYLKAVYSETNIYYDFNIYNIKLNDNNLYLLITAILNSDLINYYIDIIFRKRIESSYAKIGIEDINNIPIPKELDEYLVEEISKISKDLNEKKYIYEGKIKEKLNNLIFDLYDLNYLEKQRVRDYFIEDSKNEINEQEIEFYKTNLNECLESYFIKKPTIEHYNDKNFKSIIIEINLNREKKIDSKKVLNYIINEIISSDPTINFLTIPEKIYTKNCVYIIKNNTKKFYTETKAFEDAQEILKKYLYE